MDRRSFVKIIGIAVGTSALPVSNLFLDSSFYEKEYNSQEPYLGDIGLCNATKRYGYWTGDKWIPMDGGKDFDKNDHFSLVSTSY